MTGFHGRPIKMRQGEECEQRLVQHCGLFTVHVIPFKERSHLPEKEFGGAFYE
jgi:hypothetical protein